MVSVTRVIYPKKKTAKAKTLHLEVGFTSSGCFCWNPFLAVNLWSLKLYVAAECWLQCCTYKNLWSDLELVKYLMLNFSESLPNLHELNSTSYYWLTMAKTREKKSCCSCVSERFGHFISKFAFYTQIDHFLWRIPTSLIPGESFFYLHCYFNSHGPKVTPTTTLLHSYFGSPSWNFTWIPKITRFYHPRKLTWQMENHHV